MTDAEKALIAWACNEIRDLDEVCRSMIPGYEPLESGDMQNLKALEGMVKGVPVVEQCREENKIIEKIGQENETLKKSLAEILDMAQWALQ